MTYQKKIEQRYRKRRQQLNEEYDNKHKLLDTYCNKRIEVEVAKRIADIERISKGQVERLQDELSQQKIYVARQLMSKSIGL